MRAKSAQRVRRRGERVSSAHDNELHMVNRLETRSSET